MTRRPTQRLCDIRGLEPSQTEALFDLPDSKEVSETDGDKNKNEKTTSSNRMGEIQGRREFRDLAVS